MYTLQRAALTLDISLTTLRKWIKQAGIRTVTLVTDRKRVYIAKKDVTWLIDSHFRQLGDLNEITKRDHSYDEHDLYTVAEVAKFMGVSVKTVKRWLLEPGIETQVVVTDRRRVCISFLDFMKLALRHIRARTGEEMDLGERALDREDDCFQENADGEDLLTIEATALALGVSQDAVRKWVRRFDISKKLIYTDRERVYVPYSEVVEVVERQREEKRVVDGLFSMKYAAQFLGIAEATLGRWMEKAGISKVVVDDGRRRVYIHTCDVVKIVDQMSEKLVGDDLFSMKDATLLLGVSRRTLRKWIEEENISKTVIDGDRRRIYIHESDVLRLADLHQKGRSVESQRQNC